MTTVLAALGTGTPSRPVLELARALGASRGAAVEAFHVLESDPTGPRLAAAGLGVPLLITPGDPVRGIADALDRDGVAIGVLGRGGRAGDARPLGHVTREVIQQVAKPVVAVPPAAVVPAPGASLKVLVPLDASGTTAQAVADTIRILGRADVVALHVFSAATAPGYWDHYYYDYPDSSRELVRRWCGSAAVRVEERQGDVVSHILDVARIERVALVALAWSQDLSPGRAPVVDGVLAGTQLPVLLFPAPGVRRRELVSSTSGSA